MKTKEWIISKNVRAYALAWGRIVPKQFSLGAEMCYWAGASQRFPAWFFVEVSLVVITVQLRITVQN